MHIYFIAETKGSMSLMSLQDIEESKIVCGRKLFERVSQSFAEHPVKFNVVTDYNKLLDVVHPAI